MNDQTDQTETVRGGDDESANEASTIAARFCPSCNYDLKGLASDGECPECGSKYEKQLLLPRPLPGAFSIFLRFLWPLAILIVFSIYFFSTVPHDPRIQLGWMILCTLGLVIGIINGAVQGNMMVSKYTASANKELSFSKRLSGMSVLALGLFSITVVLPAIIVGGCLVLVFA